MKVKVEKGNSKNLLTIVPERHEVFVRGKRIHVPRAELTILTALKNSNVTMSRKDLLNLLWGKTESDRDIDTRTVDQHISRLRRRLKIDIIETVPNYGYRFNA